MKREHPNHVRCAGKRQCPVSRRRLFLSNSKPGLSVLASLFIAILPKCPLCAIAYSSAITMCSGAKIYDHQSDWTSFISIGLGIFTLAVVLWNYKGARTLIAASLILLGAAGLLHSEFLTGNTEVYYMGSVTVIAGVWVNGSFAHFARRAWRALKNRMRTGSELSELNEPA